MTAPTEPTTCTGTRYAVNPDAPEEGDDVWHSDVCPIHTAAVTNYGTRYDGSYRFTAEPSRHGPMVDVVPMNGAAERDLNLLRESIRRNWHEFRGHGAGYADLQVSDTARVGNVAAWLTRVALITAHEADPERQPLYRRHVNFTVRTNGGTSWSYLYSLPENRPNIVHVGG